MTERPLLETLALVGEIAKRIKIDVATDGGAKVNLYEEAGGLLDGLDFEAKTYPGLPYIQEKVRDLRLHLGVMAGVLEDDRHDTQQHYTWALGCLGILKGMVVFNRQKGEEKQMD